MASPIRWPPALTATYCLALFTPKFANVFTPRSLNSRSASGPSTNRSVMWWDWSSSAHVVAHARCSERQFVNSGAIGNVWARAAEFRSSSTGLPARAIAAARLSGGTPPTVGKPGPCPHRADDGIDMAVRPGGDGQMT
jgi:hypothetical protein